MVPILEPGDVVVIVNLRPESQLARAVFQSWQ